MRNDFVTGYLEHSAKGSTWKKNGAKYISRTWKNGKWVYEYKVTGKGYKKDAAENMVKSRLYGDKAKATNNSSVNENVRKSENYGRKAAEAESNYKSKSLPGVAEKTIEKGKSKINSILDKFKTTETVTITSNLYPEGTKKAIKK